MKKTKTPTTTTAIHVVLDRSGSMQTVRDDTIGAFNAYIEQVAKETPTATISLTLFDSQGIDTIYNYKPVTDAPKLTTDTYVPRASTPLYDAIGQSAWKLADTKADAKVLVILTDGYENSSREFTKEAISKLLAEKQDKDGWLVMYLGADQDAWAVGSQMGTRANSTMTFDKASMANTMSVAAAATARYATMGGGVQGQMGATFTDAERAKALGKKEDV